MLFEVGAEESVLSAIEAAAPSLEEGSAPFEIELDRLKILPENKLYLRYNGSLTTPPCTEGVRWFLFQATSTVTAEEVKVFIDRIGANARGPQPLNARMILR